jgi:hypothetical protein
VTEISFTIRKNAEGDTKQGELLLMNNGYGILFSYEDPMAG